MIFRKIRSLITNLLVMILSTVLMLSIGVLGMEIHYWQKEEKNLYWHDPNTRFDSELGWSPIPNRRMSLNQGKTISTNSLGFRSAEVDPNKKHVVLLGDSIAWGLTVSDDETVSHYLEEKLSSEEYQVHNLGVSGYGVGQIYLMLKRHINQFNHLHTVIIIFANNDRVDTGSNVSYGKSKPLFILEDGELKLTNNNIKKYNLKNLLSKSYLLRRYSQPDSKYAHVYKYLSEVTGNIRIDIFHVQNVIEKLLIEIKQLVESNGGKLILIVSPVSGVGGDFDDAKYHGLVWFENLFKTKGYDHVDLHHYITSRNINPDQIYSSDSVHYSVEGSEIVAQIIFEHQKWD